MKQVAEKDIVIAVMGATGAGKSTFINLASGSDFKVGKSVWSCTTDVAYTEAFELGGRRIVLMDTPGFDDSTKSGTDILKMIALHLSATYEQGIKLSGLIYLHRISDNRVGGICRRDFNMFRKLCGEDSLRNVVIVTNMWGKVDPEEGETREQELSGDALFGPALANGATLARHDGTLESAASILAGILRNHPEPLRIQRELVDEKLDISRTGAGEEMNKELDALVRNHRDNLEALQKEHEEALAVKDAQAERELKEALSTLSETIQNVQHDRDRLSSEYAEEKKRTEEAMRSIMEKLSVSEKELARREAELELLKHELWENRNQTIEERAQLVKRIEELTHPMHGFTKLLGDAFGALFGGRF